MNHQPYSLLRNKIGAKRRGKKEARTKELIAELQTKDATMETFQHLTLGHIKSSEGYAVRHTDRDSISYIDAERRLDIEVDAGRQQNGRYHYRIGLTSAFSRGWTRPASHPITEQPERDLIEQRIRKALEFDGAVVKFL